MSIVFRLLLTALAALLALVSVRLFFPFAPARAHALSRKMRRALNARGLLRDDAGFLMPPSYDFDVAAFAETGGPIRESYDEDDHGRGRLTLRCACGHEASHLHHKFSRETLRDAATRRHQYMVVGFHPTEGCDVCRFEATAGAVPISAWTKLRMAMGEAELLVKRLGFKPELPKVDRYAKLRRFVWDMAGGFFPTGPTEGGGYTGLFSQTAHVVSPQTMAASPVTPDQLVLPSTWAAAGTLSLTTNIDGTELSIFDPAQKLTAGNTLTISCAGGQSIDNAASLVLNAAGAGAQLHACVSADGVGTSINQYAHVTSP